jgi:hypothetical protein
MIDDELQFLIHFYNDEKFLFQTITMQADEKVGGICDSVFLERGWHSGRFSENEREYYLGRRKLVEKLLYEEYSEEFGRLQEKIPIYFYLFPNMTREKAKELAQERINHGEVIPKVIMIKIQDLQDKRNITFTINDSFTSYRKKIIESGMKLRDEETGREYFPDHNQIFPFSEIARIHEKYREKNPSYEVQVWDHTILEKVSWEILQW